MISNGLIKYLANEPSDGATQVTQTKATADTRPAEANGATSTESEVVNAMHAIGSSWEKAIAEKWPIIVQCYPQSGKIGYYVRRFKSSDGVSIVSAR